MAQIRPLIALRTGRINQPLRVPISPLLLDNIKTITTADIASGSGTLTVKNIVGFAINQILLIGEPGNEGSEIIKTHISTAPTGSTITLASNTIFPHSASTTIRVINFDQVEISTAATTTGAKSVLTTISLVADDKDTQYNDVVTSSGYYFARFKNSLTALFSPYSDPAPLSGYTIFSARSIIDSALGMINKKTSDILSDEYAFKEIDNCQMETLREFKRWSFMQSFDQIIGNTSEGTWKIALPTDCDDQNTTKSIYNFRIGKESDMVWVDKEEWNFIVDAIAFTTLASTFAIGATSITLTDSSDFDTTGTVRIGNTEYSYTANNKTTGVLTVAAVATGQTAGQDAFQNSSLGNPTYFTTFGGYLYHSPVVSSQYANRNYYLDYYKSLTQTIRDSDNIVLPDPTVVQYYLAWKFLLKINNGEEAAGSQGMYNNYILRREKTKQKESLNRQFILNPNID
jgi:hypothetical protein